MRGQNVRKFICPRKVWFAISPPSLRYKRVGTEIYLFFRLCLLNPPSILIGSIGTDSPSVLVCNGDVSRIRICDAPISL